MNCHGEWNLIASLIAGIPFARYFLAKMRNATCDHGHDPEK